MWVRQGVKPAGDEVLGDLSDAGRTFANPLRPGDPGGIRVTPKAAAAPQEMPAVATIDFPRDVQPILRQNCYSCHGPTQQMNNLRLDRRRDAMRGGTGVVIGPGASEASRLYLRLTGNQFGPQMPPTGPLKAAQVAIIKAWIDQGAQWPDEASGEAPLPPLARGDHAASDDRRRFAGRHRAEHLRRGVPAPPR